MMMMLPDVLWTSWFGIKEIMSYTVQDEGFDVEEKSFMRFIRMHVSYGLSQVYTHTHMIAPFAPFKFQLRVNACSF